MERYDYREAVKSDSLEFIREHLEGSRLHDRFDDASDAFDEYKEKAWIADSVTGNASGSYTFSTWQAEENLCHNLELLAEAMSEFGCGPDNFKGAEWADVTIRCYVLDSAMMEAIEEIWEEEESEMNEEKIENLGIVGNTETENLEV